MPDWAKAEIPTIRECIGHVQTAHVLAMGREGMLGEEVVNALVAAIARVPNSDDSTVELIDAVRDFDGRIDAQVASDVAAAGRTGRSVVDVAATVARIHALWLLARIDQLLRESEIGLLDLAERNYPVMMPVTMDGFVSQPTSVSHWLGAVLEQVGRARDAIAFAVDQTDRSPMGAGALASNGFAVDRAKLARDLGFNCPIESTFDAVSSVDWLSTVANAIDTALSPFERFGNEIFAWFRIEPEAFRIGDWLMESASGIPQWTGPYGLVRLNSDLAHLAFQAHVLANEASSVSYGPQLATLGRLMRGLVTVGTEAIEVLERVSRFLNEGLIVNAGYFANRAGRSFSTSSDLADFLILEEHLAPGEAEQIASLTINRARDQGLEAAGITVDLIDGAAMMVIGRELKVEFESISKYLAPRRFVERRTALGAPAPAQMRSFVTSKRQDQSLRSKTLDERIARWRQAMDDLQMVAATIAVESGSQV